MTMQHTPTWRLLVLMMLATALAFGGCKTAPPEEGEEEGEEPTPAVAGPYADLLKLVPGSADVTNWKPDGKVKVFAAEADPQSGVKALEQDLGQRAAAYRAYGYVASARREYVRGQAGERMTLRVFKMKTPSEAFGVFSVQAGGDQSPMVGLAARMDEDSLGFVKGSYYVALAYGGAGSATSSLMEFGRWVADRISSPGYRPALLETFPLGAVQGEQYYLHEFETLASLPFVPKADPTTMARMLDLGPGTDVAIKGYPTTREGVLNYLFVIRYPTSVDASAAYTAYKGYLKKSTDPAEHNVAVAPPVGSYLAGTFSAEENSINDRLATLLDGLGG